MASDIATEIAAQVWCQPSLSHKVMDADIASAFADILDRYITMPAMRRCSGAVDVQTLASADRRVWEDMPTAVAGL